MTYGQFRTKASEDITFLFNFPLHDIISHNERKSGVLNFFFFLNDCNIDKSGQNLISSNILFSLKTPLVSVARSCRLSIPFTHINSFANICQKRASWQLYSLHHGVVMKCFGINCQITTETQCKWEMCISRFKYVQYVCIIISVLKNTEVIKIKLSNATGQWKKICWLCPNIQ